MKLYDDGILIYIYIYLPIGKYYFEKDLYHKKTCVLEFSNRELDSLVCQKIHDLNQN